MVGHFCNAKHALMFLSIHAGVSSAACREMWTFHCSVIENIAEILHNELSQKIVSIVSIETKQLLSQETAGPSLF